jgi:transposase
VTISEREIACARSHRIGRCSPAWAYATAGLSSRRHARLPLANTESKAPQFVPAIVETALPPTVLRGRQRKRTGQASRSCGSIEVEIDGVTIRIGRGAEAKTVAAVLRALKAGA